MTWRWSSTLLRTQSLSWPAATLGNRWVHCVYICTSGLSSNINPHHRDSSLNGLVLRLSSLRVLPSSNHWRILCLLYRVWPKVYPSWWYESVMCVPLMFYTTPQLAHFWSIRLPFCSHVSLNRHQCYLKESIGNGHLLSFKGITWELSYTLRGTCAGRIALHS